MTIVVRKAILCFGVAALIANSSAAKGEDQDYSTNNQPTHQTKSYVANDQQYKIPNYYHGKYYPDDETTIGYHGTSNSAKNDAALDGNGYYYYYY